MLAFTQLGGDLPPADPVAAALQPQPKPPIVQTVKVKSLSILNAVSIGVVAGFATSLGAFLFEKALKKR